MQEHSDALPQLRERAGYGKSYERPWRIYLPHPTFTPDAPAHLEALILKAVSKTTDDKGRRYVTIQPDTCLPANTTTIAKLKAVIGEFLRWHYDRRNVLAGLSLLLGYFEHLDSKGGATTFDVDTEENAQVVRGLAHLGVRYIPDAESDAREPHRKARVVQAWFPVGLLIIASAVDTAQLGEDCQTSETAIAAKLEHRILTIDRLQAAGLCGLLQQELMGEAMEGTEYLSRSMTVLEYVALMLDDYLPLSDAALDIALGLRACDRSKFFSTGEFVLIIMGTPRTYVISESILLDLVVNDVNTKYGIRDKYYFATVQAAKPLSTADGVSLDVSELLGQLRWHAQRLADQLVRQLLPNLAGGTNPQAMVTARCKAVAEDVYHWCYAIWPPTCASTATEPHTPAIFCNLLHHFPRCSSPSLHPTHLTPQAVPCGHTRCGCRSTHAQRRDSVHTDIARRPGTRDRRHAHLRRGPAVYHRHRCAAAAVRQRVIAVQQ